MKMLNQLSISTVFALTLNMAFAENLTVFAAASMNNVLQEIGQDFEQKYPEDKIIFSFASSSALAKQIEQDLQPIFLFQLTYNGWITLHKNSLLKLKIE